MGAEKQFLDAVKSNAKENIDKLIVLPKRSSAKNVIKIKRQVIILEKKIRNQGI